MFKPGYVQLTFETFLSYKILESPVRNGLRGLCCPRVPCISTSFRSQSSEKATDLCAVKTKTPKTHQNQQGWTENPQRIHVSSNSLVVSYSECWLKYFWYRYMSTSRPTLLKPKQLADCNPCAGFNLIDGIMLIFLQCRPNPSVSTGIKFSQTLHPM